VQGQNHGAGFFRDTMKAVRLGVVGSTAPSY
jgi:hypothetical protein